MRTRTYASGRPCIRHPSPNQLTEEATKVAAVSANDWIVPQTVESM